MRTMMPNRSLLVGARATYCRSFIMKMLRLDLVQIFKAAKTQGEALASDPLDRYLNDTPVSPKTLWPSC